MDDREGVDVSEVNRDLETWLPVVGYEGHYEVSDLGRVRSVDRFVGHPHADRAALRGKILRPTPDGNGRLTVKLSRRGVTKTKLVHHLVIEAHHRPRPVGMLACHNNGDHADNRAVNLRWGTPSDNMRDMTLHGTNYSANKTHCPRGHMLKAPNLVASRAVSGHRICLACARARANVQAAYGRGQHLDFIASADAHYQKIMGLAA